MAKFASDLSGEGARLFGGRWNSVGKACLYTSDHSALAMLEVAVHHTTGNIPPNLKLIRLEVPDELLANAAQVLSLKYNFHTVKNTGFTRDIGDEWLTLGENPVLKVPSVLIPYAFNILINPRHSDAQLIRVSDVTDILLDQRIKE